MIVDFLDVNRGHVVDGRKLGVEPICRVLQVAASLYYAAKTQPISARSQRDAVTGPAIVQLWHDNYRVYRASCGRPPVVPTTTSAEIRSPD